MRDAQLASSADLPEPDSPSTTSGGPSPGGVVVEPVEVLLAADVDAGAAAGKCLVLRRLAVEWVRL